MIDNEKDYGNAVREIARLLDVIKQLEVELDAERKKYNMIKKDFFAVWCGGAFALVVLICQLVMK